MRVLITGANGLLGQKLASLLQQKSGQFVATGRGPCRIPIENISYRQLDVTQAEEAMYVINEEKPGVVVHTAAMTNVDECEQNRQACWLHNVTAVENIVAACSKSGSFLVHLSTDFIFDGKTGPYTEEDEPRPVSYYGESKLAAENIVMRSNIAWAIVRTVLVYGISPGMSRSNIILWVKKSLEEGKNIRVVNDQWRTPTLAEDLALGCYLIAKKKAEGVFNISGKNLLTPYEMALATARYFGLDKSLISETNAAEFREPAKRPPKTGLVLDKARRVLGYEPRSFDEGIGILAEQLRR